MLLFSKHSFMRLLRLLPTHNPFRRNKLSGLLTVQFVVIKSTIKALNINGRVCLQFDFGCIGIGLVNKLITKFLLSSLINKYILYIYAFELLQKI